MLIEIDVTQELIEKILSCFIFEQDIGDYGMEFTELFERIVEQNENVKELIYKLNEEEDKRLNETTNRK